MTHYVLPGAAFRHSHSHRAWDLCVFSGKLLRGVFPKNCCQFQLVISSTQYLLHAWHHQHHLHQLHVHRIHHLHHLHQLQWTSSTSYTHTHTLSTSHIMLFTQELLHRSLIHRTFCTGVPLQEFLYRSSYTGVLHKRSYAAVVTQEFWVLLQEFLRWSSSTGVISTKAGRNQGGWKEPRLEGGKEGRKEKGRKEGMGEG